MAGSLSDASAHYRKAPRYRIAPESKWFVVLLAMIVTLPSFSIDSCLASLTSIGVSLHSPPAATALVLSLFMVGFGCGQMIFGPLCDRFGRRPALLWGCVLFTLAAVGCALAPSIESLVFWRFVQGVGSAAGSVTISGIMTLVSTMPLLMLNTFATGLVSPNVVHGTLEPLPEIAGVASSVFGGIRMTIGAIASELVAMLYRGTPMAMSETMTLFATAALVCACLLFLPLWRRTHDGWKMSRKDAKALRRI
jgi:MFS family permease